MPVSDPKTKNGQSDRPWSVILITPDDPVAAISAAELIQFPNNAPILFVDESGIPAVTLEELQRLSPVGVERADGVQAFVIGAAASPNVLNQLQQIGLKTRSITARDNYALANQIDTIYGQIHSPDTGVPTMMNSVKNGNGIMDVFIGSTDAPLLMLPIAEWASHLPSGILWIDSKTDKLPRPTVEALSRRKGKAMIYVMGGSEQVSPALIKELSQYGSVARVTNDDQVLSNAPLTPNPVTVSVVFARMWDPTGLVGWNMVGAGHGFTIVNSNDWQSAVAAAILSSRGFHAALLLTDNAQHLSKPVADYLDLVRPTFTVTPAEGPYNRLYVIGDYSNISWMEQVEMNSSQEIANRHDAPNGSTYLSPP
ncbi:hypothetical protein [Scytonema sp. NUACC26]|uniref:hypothetical protein n=1 Tax=Scytonema sp. NUACC26 TaxID=3140176 RepID=UPI0038B4171F